MSNAAAGPDRAFRIVVNPASGGGRAMKAVAPVADLLRAAGATVAVVPSQGPEHAIAQIELATQAGEQLVACGGDGMLASMAGAVVAAGCSLGIIPSGRGNDFARMLGLPNDPEKIAVVLLQGVPTATDVIDVDGQIVLGSVYAGVDSLASELVNGAHWLPGAMQYPYAAVRALLTHQPTTYTIEVDGVRHTYDGYSIVVANSGYYGKGMLVAPSAEVADGVLDVVVIPKTSRFRLIRLMPQIYSGAHVEQPDVITLRGAQVEVSATSRVVAYGDGEPLRDLPLSAHVVPGALKVLLPA